VKELAGKVAIVTGAAGGLGAAVTRALAAEGMKVAAADISMERLQGADKTGGAHSNSVLAVRLDVTDFDAWRRAVAEVEAALGPVSVLVNCAGLGGSTVVAEEDPRRWRVVMAINADGPFYGCRAVLPGMLARGEPAHIVNIASFSGLHSHAGMASYAASKFAVVGMTHSLRAELAGTNVGLSVFYPGLMHSTFGSNSDEVIRSKIGSGRGEAAPDPATVNDLWKAGMDTNKVAARVVRAIRERDYHVFTHPLWRPVLEADLAELMASFDEGADPSHYDDLAEQTLAADTAMRALEAEGGSAGGVLRAPFGSG
jgi:NAD(P)-dependent dehydrogenase (short-subunit alcohol dehydrogenase family)